MTKITEHPGKYRDLEKKSIHELTASINAEDKTVALAIEKELPKINALIEAIVNKLESGGRLFYLGAGSGGRLSVLDVIELPTTYGVEPGMVDVKALLAGNDVLLFAENVPKAMEQIKLAVSKGQITQEEIDYVEANVK